MNLLKRSISGIIYVALIISAILTRTYTEWWFLTVFSLFIALGIHEVHTLGKGKENTTPTLLQLVDIAGGIGIYGSLHLQLSGLGERVLWLIPVAVYFLIRTIIQLYLPRHNALSLIMRSALSVFYVAIPMALMHALVSVSNVKMLLAMFIFIWAFDSGAFIIGTALGKHRLFERISPKKSWEGVFGGIAVTMLVAWCMFVYFNDFFVGPMRLYIWLLMSIVCAVFATFGDLFESLLKRTAGVKDSGNIIPGHGGILDRIDSMLFVIPAVFVFFYVMNLIA